MIIRNQILPKRIGIYDTKLFALFGGASYVTDGLIVDYSTVGEFTVVDKIAGLNATMETGIYASSDGVTDKLIGAYASSLGVGDYKLTGKVRMATAGTAYATINGNSLTYTVTADNVWEEFETTVSIAGAPSDIYVGWNGGVLFSACDWSDVKLVDDSDDLVKSRFQLNDSPQADLDKLPCIDSVGGFNGVHIGGASGTGEGGILQMGGMDFNERMWFDGVDDYVSVPSSAGIGATTSLNIKMKFMIAGSSGVHRLIRKGVGSNTNYAIDVNAGKLRFFGYSVGVAHGTISPIFSPVPYHLYDAEFDFDGTTWSIILDGVTVESVTDPTTLSTTTSQLEIGLNSGQYTTGLIFDININDNAKYIGNGVTDVGWVDQIGSNNGTVNGSPSPYYVPKVGSTDAFGNEIDNPRPNNQVINLTAEDATVSIGPDASLDPTKTVSFWGYYDGSSLITYIDSTDGVVVGATSGELTSLGFTDPTYHINGVETTTLEDGWNSIQVTSTAALNSDDFVQMDQSQGNLRLYSTVLTTADALQNFNAGKSKYGI